MFNKELLATICECSTWRSE